MPRPDTLERFIAQVCSGDHVGAIEAFYADNASMRENFDAPREGKATLLRHEQAVLQRATRVDTEWLPPALVNGDTVAIRWRFRFTWKNGASTEIEEVAWQHWAGESIVHEQFFYDPAQLRARSATPATPTSPTPSP